MSRKVRTALHPAFGFIKARRDELPDFVKYRGTRDDNPAMSANFDLGVERLAHPGAESAAPLAAGHLANRPGQHMEKRIGDQVRDDEAESDGDEGANQPRLRSSCRCSISDIRACSGVASMTAGGVISSLGTMRDDQLLSRAV